MKKVLIFDPWISQARAVAKYLKKYSDFYLTGVSRKPVYIRPKYFDEIVVCDYHKINLNDYNYILPVGAESTKDIVTEYGALKYENKINFKKENLIVFDKPVMLDIVKSLGLPVPETWLSSSKIKNFPIFYKEAFEVGDGLTGKAECAQDLPKRDGIIFQEYIDTPSTYGVGFLAINGEIKTYFIHKEVISYPREGGSGVVLEQFYDDRLLSYTSRILKKLQYNGWGLAEYKFCNNKNDFLFMEINGKFWASVEFALANNPEFLKYLFNVKYSAENIERILFLNRLLENGFFDIIKNLKYLFNSFCVIDKYILIPVIKKVIPAALIQYFKNQKIK